MCLLNKLLISLSLIFLTLYLMATAVALFVIDVIVRKIKLNDIKSLFKRHKTGGKTNEKQN